jgi:tetratricopeptide (TPR) repeat protein
MVGPGFHNALDRQRVAWFSGNEEHEKTLMTHWDVHNDSDVLSAVHAAIVQGHVKEAYQLLAILTHHGEFQSLDIAGGALLLNERQFSEAIKYFRRAIVVVPEDAKGYELLADAYLQLGRNAEALPLADRAVVLTTGNGLRHDFVRGTPMDQAQAFNLRAHIEENLGRRDDALADYRQEVTLGRLTQDVLGRLYPGGQPSRYCDLSDSLEGSKRLGAGAP